MPCRQQTAKHLDLIHAAGRSPTANLPGHQLQALIQPFGPIARVPSTHATWPFFRKHTFALVIDQLVGPLRGD